MTGEQQAALSPTSCNQCGKNFKRGSYLKAHLRRHEEWDAEAAKMQHPDVVQSLAEEGNEHACRLCSRSFATRHSLVLHHARRHTPRPYRCEVCGRRFINAPNLRIHQRVHSGERLQFECVCGKGFAWKTALMSHRKRCRQLNGGGGTAGIILSAPTIPTPPAVDMKRVRNSDITTVDADSIHADNTTTNSWLEVQQNGEAPRQDVKRLTEVFWAGNFELERHAVEQNIDT